jgi:uncharacterized protein
MKQRTSRTEKIAQQIKRNPIVASLLFLGTAVIALSTFTDAAKKLFSVIPGQSPEAARAALGGMSLKYTSEEFVQCADRGDLTAVKLFLNAGMNPNAADDEGGTALMHAAYKGHTGVVAALLKVGADANQRHGSHSALRSAASGGQVDIVRALLAKRPNAETLNDAFVEAVRMRRHDIVRLLAGAGASVGKAGALAITILAQGTWGDEEVRETAKLVLDLGADPNGQDKEGWTPLLQAAGNEYPSSVRLLLDRGADANAQCSCPDVLGGGWTPLTMATNSRRQAVVEALLDKGADVNQRNTRGETALILAAYAGDVSIVHQLLDRGADVNVKTGDGRTALMGVAAGTTWPDRVVDHPEVVLALLAKGADVSAQDAHGRTALMLAAQSGSTPVVRSLLKAGAPVTVRDVDGNTALGFAQKELQGQRNANVIRLLEEAGAK